MRTLQLYATGSATATSVASVTIPSPARIMGIQIALGIDSVTDNAMVRLELSKVPTNQIATNGALDPFLEINLAGNFATSGLAQAGVNQFFPVDIPCRQGELVYVHVTIGGTVTYYFNAILHYA
jgi:hypothetical protein